MKNDPNASYRLTGAVLGDGTAAAQIADYFGNNARNPIICVEGRDVQPVPKADITDVSALDRLRMRGISDDLYIDRQQQEFDAASKASISLGGSALNSYSTKVVGAFGYAFDAGLNGQIVPYFALNQSITDAAGKPRVIDPTNFVAVGVLANNFFDDPWTTDVKDVVTVKPQYLLNTADQSEIASLRAIYAPWTYFADAPISLNRYQYMPFIPIDVLGTVLFDLRTDIGTYTNKGNTAKIAAMNQDFSRAGFRVGYSMTTTNPNLPSFTLTVAETYLYGLTGFDRTIDVFQADFTWNLDKKKYLGLTASYKHGRDEDTAVAATSWALGLTAKY